MTSLTIPQLQANIVRRRILKDLPSASGIEYCGGNWYIIGDDSPWLYILDNEWQIIQKIALFVPERPATLENAGAATIERAIERIPKALKPDFEMLTVLKAGSEEMLLAAGSGSLSPQRDAAYVIRPNNNHQANRISLTPLYDQLRAMPEVVGNGRLNLEGLAADAECVFFLQRGNVSGKNVLIQYDLPAFMDFLTGLPGQLPIPKVYSYRLPSLGGLQSGFSGASLLPATIDMQAGQPVLTHARGTHTVLLFTASIEDTADEILDGQSMGSLVGFIDFSQPEQLSGWAWINEGGKKFTGKVESIISMGILSPTELQALAITDNDFGDSEILELRISWG
jgi:hypothetical protein